ncbi:hypothetical protein [Lysinibacillus xylanilyticus]|uniref:hypothetical protein n=1 Tax=Lysinibacillus xylanilyticus TaxID=582475 RepID=UPI00128B4B78
MISVPAGCFPGGVGATDVFCAKAKRQWQQQDVGHEGVITGRYAFSLRSSIRFTRAPGSHL